MSKIGIVGYGIVGRAIAYGFGDSNSEYGFRDKHKILAYDKYPKDPKEVTSLEEVVENSEFIFVCVPTPYKENKGIWNYFKKLACGYSKYDIDLSIMDDVIRQITRITDGTNKIVIIKSTVIPGTTRKYSKKYPETNFCMNPEFLTNANYLDDFVNAGRIVIGADNKDIGSRVSELYKDRFPKIPIIKVNLTEAEMTKYMFNCFLSTKVIFGNEMKAFCNKLDIDYDKVKQGVTTGSGIGESYLKVPGPDGDVGFGGKCFPKDFMALIALGKKIGVDVSILETVWHKNLRVRKKKDWEDIPWAKTQNNIDYSPSNSTKVKTE